MNIKWIDSHCHCLDYRDDENLFQEALKGISEELLFAIEVSTTLDESILILEMLEKYSFLFGTQGIHPLSVEDIKDEKHFQDQLVKNLQHPKIVALGEIGLDYHYEGYDPKKQDQIFRLQMEVASELKMPVVIHNRDAFDETIKVLNDFKSVPVVFHCFNGTQEQADKVMNLGGFLSFTGVITFGKKVEYLKDLIRSLPLDRFFIETDTPYLTPSPHRGKKNFPHWVKFVGEEMSQILDIEIEKMAKIFELNTKRFFNKIH